jgi:hypothetical protein
MGLGPNTLKSLHRYIAPAPALEVPAHKSWHPMNKALCAAVARCTRRWLDRLCCSRLLCTICCAYSFAQPEPWLLLCVHNMLMVWAASSLLLCSNCPGNYAAMVSVEQAQLSAYAQPW